MEVDRDRQVLDCGVLPSLTIESFNTGKRIVANQPPGDEPQVVSLLTPLTVSGVQGHGLGVSAALVRAGVGHPFTARNRVDGVGFL